MEILQRSAVGGVLIALVWLARGILRRRAPAWMRLLLWAAVLMRLLLPGGFEVSVPTAADVGRQREMAAPSESVQIFASAFPERTGLQAERPMEFDHSKMITRWLVHWAGAGLSAAAFAALYAWNRRKLGRLKPVESALPMRAGWRPVKLYESERVASPVSMGLIFPRIILPCGMKPEDAGVDLMIAHELAHIGGFHGLWKAAALAAVCMHWFNPLVWVMRALISRDLELIADEAAIRKDSRRREEYAYLLIRMAEKGGGPVSVNGFGGRKTRERIVSVMKQRKNSVWAILLAVILLTASVCAFAEPVQQREEQERINIEDGIRTTMSREEFRQWYRLRLELALAAGEVTEAQYDELIEDKLEALLTCVGGDEIRKVTVVRHEDGIFQGEVNLIEGDDGVWRIVFASSQPLYDVMGAPAEQLGADLALLRPQTGPVFDGEIYGMMQRGTLYEAFAPGGSLEEIKAAGMAFCDQAVGMQENKEQGLTSVTMQADLHAAMLRLDGYEVEGALFQFVNGGLVSVELNLPDGESANAIRTSLTAEMGEPSESSMQGVSDETRLYLWEYPEEDRMVRAMMSVRTNKNDLMTAAVQVAWLPDGVFGIISAEQE